MCSVALLGVCVALFCSSMKIGDDNKVGKAICEINGARTFEIAQVSSSGSSWWGKELSTPRSHQPTAAVAVSGTNEMPSSIQAASGVSLGTLHLRPPLHRVHIQRVQHTEPKEVAPSVSAVLDYGTSITLVQGYGKGYGTQAITLSDGVTGVQRPTSGNFYETTGISFKLLGAIGLISRSRGQAHSACDASRVLQVMSANVLAPSRG